MVRRPHCRQTPQADGGNPALPVDKTIYLFASGQNEIVGRVGGSNGPIAITSASTTVAR